MADGISFTRLCDPSHIHGVFKFVHEFFSPSQSIGCDVLWRSKFKNEKDANLSFHCLISIKEQFPVLFISVLRGNLKTNNLDLLEVYHSGIHFVNL